jgi:hypothetical protein
MAGTDLFATPTDSVVMRETVYLETVRIAYLLYKVTVRAFQEGLY